MTLLRNVKPASKSSQFPLYSRTAKVWGNVLRIDFPIYIFHFFSFSDIESHTCDWKEGEKKLRIEGVSKWLFFLVNFLLILHESFSVESRVMIFFEWTTLNVRAFLECLACLGLLS